MSGKREWYVIRRGWNAANQSSVGGRANPRDQFESRYLALVAIVEADTEEEAIRQANVTAYNGQSVFAVRNPRSIAGLTREARRFFEPETA
jgi:hypothetical protein